MTQFKSAKLCCLRTGGANGKSFGSFADFGDAGKSHKENTFFLTLVCLVTMRDYPNVDDFDTPFPLYDDKTNPKLHFRTTRAVADFCVNNQHVPVPEGYALYLFKHPGKKEVFPTDVGYKVFEDEDYLLTYNNEHILLITDYGSPMAKRYNLTEDYDLTEEYKECLNFSV